MNHFFRFVFLYLISLPLFAADEYIEIGVLTGGQYLNEYRGSKAREWNSVLLPFLYYNGEIFKVDRKGARAEFFSNEHLELKLSAEASLSGGGKNTVSRVGMPELDSAFELGPSANFNLTGDFNRGWEIDFPLRAVITANLEPKLDYQGFIFNPKFTYKFPTVWGGWQVKSQLGATFATKKLHNYYYGVEPKYVLEDRPEYTAKPGYSGAYFKSSIRQRRGDFLYSFSVRYDYLDGAVFTDSPLYETDDYFSVSILVAYMFGKVNVNRLGFRSSKKNKAQNSEAVGEKPQAQ